MFAQTVYPIPGHAHKPNSDCTFSTIRVLDDLPRVDVDQATLIINIKVLRVYLYPSNLVLFC